MTQKRHRSETEMPTPLFNVLNCWSPDEMRCSHSRFLDPASLSWIQVWSTWCKYKEYKGPCFLLERIFATEENQWGNWQKLHVSFNCFAAVLNLTLLHFYSFNEKLQSLFQSKLQVLSWSFLNTGWITRIRKYPLIVHGKSSTRHSRIQLFSEVLNLTPSSQIFSLRTSSSILKHNTSSINIYLK